ncbi:class I triheme cytochrome c [Gemmobacter aquarius]|uniref:Class I triheme cytochrome c n=1 Tax=Paragemmobacter aquarius TaxID=2169400 RepID=A0A2S0UK40_9RHOB|nr:c-type cytochrome [Gemmobacter aquarius]AWB48130.1 class I triheme cytochrome c [Gemmobacter aquarius]
MNRVLATLAVLAALGTAAAAATIGFGLYNVSARQGHLAPVAWALHTTFRHSAKLRAPPQSAVPPLTDDMAALGARHYDRACRTCHGTPGTAASATIRAMVPPPPPILQAVADHPPNQLYWIVHEGIKMTAMPPWPAPRKDEAWSIAAFLTRLRDGMTPQEYTALTAPPETPPDAPRGFAYCAGCHGANGRSENPLIPRLDLQDAAYLTRSLQAYADGQRQSGFMAEAATSIPATSLADLAAYFASLPTADTGQSVDPGLAAKGAALAQGQTASPDVPACVACHGPRQTDANRRLIGPDLAGQYPAYLEAQLRLWRDGNRGGGPKSNLMAKAARSLTDDQIEALAAWFAGLQPSTTGPAKRTGPTATITTP